jgi:uncharacterized protein (TIGR02145 family)
MTTTTTLTLPENGQAGPFDLYSDTDDYQAAFELDIATNLMVAGFTSSNVPDGTTIIRVQSTTACENYVDIQVTKEITIGTQTFLNKNVGTTTFTDGTVIPYVPSIYGRTSTKSACWYWVTDSFPTPVTEEVRNAYGKVYNGYALYGIATPESNPPTALEIAARKKIAPDGYHVPTWDEYITLKTYLDGIFTEEYGSTAGKRLKAKGNITDGTGFWKKDFTTYPFPEPNNEGTDDYGFGLNPTKYIDLDGYKFEYAILSCKGGPDPADLVSGIKLRYNTKTIDQELYNPIYQMTVDTTIRLIKDSI